MFTPFDFFAFQIVTTPSWTSDDDLWLDTCTEKWIVAPDPGRFRRVISRLRRLGGTSSVAPLGARSASGQDGNAS